jgi:hypothetical protein
MIVVPGFCPVIRLKPIVDVSSVTTDESLATHSTPVVTRSPAEPSVSTRSAATPVV